MHLKFSNGKTSDGKLLLSLLFLIGIVTSFCIGCNFDVINDGFWHIKSGEYIIKNGFIPRNAVFSWYGTINNLKWINHEWLFGIIAYLIYSINGFTSVTIFMGVFNAISSILVYIYSFKRCKNSFLALICLYCYTLFSFYTMSFRPMMLTRIILLTFCILLEDKKFVPSLIVLVLGINVQGGVYPLYLFILGCYALFEHYKYFVAAFICILINPYTYNLYLYDIHLFSSFKGNPGISEWTYTAIYNYKALLFVIIISVLTYWLSNISLRNVIFSGGLIFLSITAVRQILVLFMLLPAVISPFLEESVCNFSKLYILSNKFTAFLENKLKKSKEKVFLNILCTLTLIVCFFSSAAFLDDYTDKIFRKHISFSITLSNLQYPIDACTYVNNHPEIRNSRIFNDYNISPYLIFRQVPTFVDSRTDIFISGFNKTTSYIDQSNATGNYKQMLLNLKKYNIDYIFMKKDYMNIHIIKRTNIVRTEYEDPYYIILKVNKMNLKNAISRNEFFQ